MRLIYFFGAPIYEYESSVAERCFPTVITTSMVHDLNNTVGSECISVADPDGSGLPYSDVGYWIRIRGY
jgi:hypothetical protein